MEITDLELNGSGFGGSSNFGGGLELLMNDKVKDGNKPTSEIELEDLNNLENELNNLVEEIPTNSFKPKSDLFSSPDNADNPT